MQFGFDEEEEEDEKPEVFDPNNIVRECYCQPLLLNITQPDFGDMMAELKVKREQRAKEEAAHREELKRKFEEAKRLEKEALAQEMEVRVGSQNDIHM